MEQVSMISKYVAITVQTFKKKANIVMEKHCIHLIYEIG